MNANTTRFSDLVPYPFELCDFTNKDLAEAHFSFLSILSNKELYKFLEWKTSNGLITRLSAVDAVFLNRLKKFQQDNWGKGSQPETCREN